MPDTVSPAVTASSPAAAPAQPPPRACLDNPHVRLVGSLDADSVTSLLDQLGEVPEDADPVAIELCTQGGDAEIGRRLALEVDLARKRFAPRRLVFIGKTEVYSAGVTMMGGFPRSDRFLTEDAVLLVHGRQLEKTVEIDGAMRASLDKVNALKGQIEHGLKLEEACFTQLIEGSDIELDELLDRALYNWYIPAELALERGLIAAIL